MLREVDFFSQTLSLTSSQVRKQVTVQEIVERDRSYAFKESFHLADGQEERDQYAEVMKFLVGVQKVQANQDWMYFCTELLDD